MRGVEKNKKIIEKMMKYCDDAAEILANKNYSRDVYETETVFRYATAMCIIQLGELVTRLDDDFMTAYKDIPWRQIKGMRNIYAHDYDVVDTDAEWEALTVDILDQGQVSCRP